MRYSKQLPFFPQLLRNESLAEALQQATPNKSNPSKKQGLYGVPKLLKLPHAIQNKVLVGRWFQT